MSGKTTDRDTVKKIIKSHPIKSPPDLEKLWAEYRLRIDRSLASFKPPFQLGASCLIIYIFWFSDVNLEVSGLGLGMSGLGKKLIESLLYVLFWCKDAIGCLALFNLLKGCNILGVSKVGKLIVRMNFASYLATTVVFCSLLALQIGSWLELHVALWNVNTSAISIAFPASVAGALLSLCGLLVFLIRLPKWLSQWRLAGRLSATMARDAHLLAFFVMVAAIIALVTPGPLVQWQAPLLVMAGGFVQLQRVGGGAAERQAGLWVVVASESEIPGLPDLLERIARGNQDRPLIFVSTSSNIPQGDHLRLADRLGLLDCLFPKLDIELRDWRQTLPPDECWRSVPFRQVHLPTSKMPTLLEEYQAAGDRTLIICRPEDDLSVWAGRLPADRTRVLIANSEESSSEYKKFWQRILKLFFISARTRFANAQIQQARLGGYKVIRPELSDTSLNAMSWFSLDDIENAAALPRVFISYPAVYRAYAMKLDALLRPHVNLRYDADLRAGENWAEVLPAMLLESDLVISLVGSATQGSKAKSEIEEAIKAGKKFIPVFVNPPDPSSPAMQFMAANVNKAGQIAWLEAADARLDQVLGDAVTRILDALSQNKTQ